MTTSSRMLYAFARYILGLPYFTHIYLLIHKRAHRDNGLPFSHQFSKIHPTLHVPLNALILTALPVLVMGNLYLISTAALNSFLSASVIALSISYGFPVFLNVLAGRSKLPKDRCFRLGKLTGWICNLIGLAFTLGATVLFMLPPTFPATRGNMSMMPFSRSLPFVHSNRYTNTSLLKITPFSSSSVSLLFRRWPTFLRVENPSVGQ